MASGTCLNSGTNGTGAVTAWSAPSQAIDTTASQIVAVYIDRQGTATDSDSARQDGMILQVIG